MVELWEGEGRGNKRVRQTADGGYIVAQGRQSGVGDDNEPHYSVLIKTDDRGNVEWERRFSEARANYTLWGVSPVEDGGYVASGVIRERMTGDYDGVCFKTDPSGRIEWHRRWKETNLKVVFSVEEVAGGGFVLYGSGWCGNRCYSLVKVNESGELEWLRSYNLEPYGPNYQRGTATRDGGHILLGGWGTTPGSGSESSRLIRTDSRGHELWVREFPYVLTMRVKETSDRGFILAAAAGPKATLEQEAPVYEAKLVKTDSDGELEWEAVFPSSRCYARFYDVAETADGGYLALGSRCPSPGLENGVLVKVDRRGTLVWERTSHDAHVIWPTRDGGHIMATQWGLIKLAPEALFRRSDADGDGRINVTDAVVLLRYIIQGAEPPPCPDAADADDTGKLDLNDAIFLLSHVFGGKSPPPPGPLRCGADPTEDWLYRCEYGTRSCGQ